MSRYFFHVKLSFGSKVEKSKSSENLLDPLQSLNAVPPMKDAFSKKSVCANTNKKFRWMNSAEHEFDIPF